MSPALLNLIILITFTPISLLAEQEVANKIKNVFQNIEKNHGKLKQLFQELVHDTSPVTSFSEPVVKSNQCICVPYYLCNIKKGQIIKDGYNIVESRINDNPNPCSGFNICCEKDNINDPMKAPTDYKCGFGSKLEQPTLKTPSFSSKFGEFPWTVLIFNSTNNYQCVGSLIHPQVILTAAHCLNLSNSYLVLAGAWDLANKNDLYPSQRSQVERIIKHPEFILNNLFYDAALLILREPFNLTENIKTTCLAASPPQKLQTDYNACAASGWGRTLGSVFYSRIMKKVELSLLPTNKCESSLRSTRLGKWFELHQSFVCAYGLLGQDLCDGDGGGPLVCSVNGERGRYQQVGVTSWGIGCGEMTPGVFTKVSRIKNWIDAQFDALEIDKQFYTL